MHVVKIIADTKHGNHVSAIILETVSIDTWIIESAFNSYWYTKIILQRTFLLDLQGNYDW